MCDIGMHFMDRVVRYRAEVAGVTVLLTSPCYGTSPLEYKALMALNLTSFILLRYVVYPIPEFLDKFLTIEKGKRNVFSIKVCICK